MRLPDQEEREQDGLQNNRCELLSGGSAYSELQYLHVKPTPDTQYQHSEN